jgi:nitroreductase
MTPDAFAALVARAALAPSVHNTQPARFRLEGGRILIGADPAVFLAAGDPERRDAGLSCGAAVEAMVLALSEAGIGAVVEDRWPGDDRATMPGLRLAAVVTPGGVVAADLLTAMLERRFTHRGTFAAGGPGAEWRPADAVLIGDAAGKARIAALNDAVSLKILGRREDRAELLRWMRLNPRHPGWGRDGMSREALRMTPFEGWAAGMALGPLWGLLDRMGITKGITAEAVKTETAAVIAGFHRPAGESPVGVGRAYLRLTLDAAVQGLAMWPMAALTDDPETRVMLEAELGVPEGHRLVQVLRLGRADRPAPPRARRPVRELMV